MVNSNGAYCKANKENDRVKKVNLGSTYKIEGMGAGNKCGKCREPAQNRGLQCDDCNFWFHVGCSSVNDKTYDILQKIEEFDWRCIGCK